MHGLLVCRIRGIDIRLNWSVAVVAMLIAWSLADSLFPEVVEGRTTTAYWVAGALTSVLFLVALVAHELSHAITAMSEGVRVRAITLWLFGGVAELESKPANPGAALRIAAAGPAMSGLIGIAAIVMSFVTTGLVGAAIAWLGVMNLILMVFNLLPAFPLDGGRIYQAWLWNRGGDEATATTRAVGVGLQTGGVLVFLGVLQAMLGGLVGGVWLMAIGWFLREAARTELRSATIDRPLAELAVADVMTPDPITVPATTALDAFITNLLHGGRHAAYPVTDDAGTAIGLITISDVRRATTPRKTGMTVADLAVPLSEVATTSPTTTVGGLLRDMSGRPQGRALVFEGDVLVGIVSPSDLARLISVVELAASRQS